MLEQVSNFATKFSDIKNYWQHHEKSKVKIHDTTVVQDGDLVQLRRQCGWFQWFEIAFYFAFGVQEIPFYLKYDRSVEKYVVVTCKKWKIIWAVLHLSGAVVFWTENAHAIRSIRASRDKVQYFDLLHSIGWLAFDYPFMYKLATGLDSIQEFFDELQSSPLLRIAPPRTRLRAGLAIALNGWYMVTLFMFFLICWGVYYFSLSDYYDTIRQAGELHFGIPASMPPSRSHSLLMFFTFFVTHFQYSTLLSEDLLALTCIIVMNRIAHDLDAAIDSGELSDDEVYSLIEAQKRLTIKFNRPFGLLVSIFVLSCTPYYSLHLTEIMEVPGNMNRMSMFTYMGLLALACKWCMDIIIMAKRRNRWLVSRKLTLLRDRPTCAIFLDDITMEKYGLGSIFKVNKYVSGQVFSLIITVAIVRVQIAVNAAKV